MSYPYRGPGGQINPLSQFQRMADIDRRWLMKKWKLVREAQQNADEASREWNRMNDAFKARCEGSGITDAVDIAYRKQINLELKEHMSKWDWWSREAQRHMQDIQTFKTMKDLGAL